MKYIYKDELIKTLQKSPVWTGLDAIARINAMDTIDIVRCKECRHWCKGDEVYGICYRCPNTRQMRCDDFCSYGERKNR